MPVGQALVLQARPWNWQVARLLLFESSGRPCWNRSLARQTTAGAVAMFGGVGGADPVLRLPPVQSPELGVSRESVLARQAVKPSPATAAES